jgi:hypothetical protein
VLATLHSERLRLTTLALLDDHTRRHRPEWAGRLLLYADHAFTEPFQFAAAAALLE